jgi:hypothetical protein
MSRGVGERERERGNQGYWATRTRPADRRAASYGWRGIRKSVGRHARKDSWQV